MSENVSNQTLLQFVEQSIALAGVRHAPEALPCSRRCELIKDANLVMKLVWQDLCIVRGEVKP